MLKNLCKIPDCPNLSFRDSEYCKRHIAELKKKSKEYLKEMNKND